MTEEKKKRRRPSKIVESSEVDNGEVEESVESAVGKAVQAVKQNTAAPAQKVKRADFSRVISTGSTLLDLAISGGRVTGGGIPGGIFMEIAGGPSQGKTLLALEIAAYIKAKGGKTSYIDAEGRLDKVYAKKLGLDIKDNEYITISQVEELRPIFEEWTETLDDEHMNCFIIDGLASLSTDMEMDGKDKRSQSRARAIHQFFRQCTSAIGDKNWIFIFTNQVRETATGYITPGGSGKDYMSSCSLMAGPHPKGKYIKVKKSVLVGEKAKVVEQITGVRTLVRIKKSSIDNGFREAPVTILFQYGVDDVSESIQYIKDYKGYTTYICPDKESFRKKEDAVQYIEEKGLEKALQEQVIDTWEKVQESFVPDRKTKVRE